jgi:hypothetical protein
MSEVVLDDMPAWLDRRHADLLTAARYCYDLRRMPASAPHRAG